MTPPDRERREGREGRDRPAPPGAPERPSRVRVTGPERRPAKQATTRAREIDQDTAVGAIYMGSLLREQLRLAGGVLLALALTLGSLPLVFHLAPGLAATRVLGVPIPWLVLGVAAYPLLLVLGWFYVRRAERNEAAFVELLSEREGRR